MLPTAKQMPKMEARFFPAIWLGKETSTNENILGISDKVKRSRAMRRLVKPEKYNNKQLLDVINNTPVTTPTASSFIMLPTAKIVATPKTTTETQTPSQQEEALPTTTAQPSTHTHKTSTSRSRCANGNSNINTKGKSTIANANIKARRGR
jgi:hypothetical protein